MTHDLDALSASADITTSYRRYLRSLMPVRDAAIGRALADRIETDPILSKGPFIEATPPYKHGASLADLVAEGVLGPGFADLESPALPMDRPLYVHQERAVRKVARGRNLIVSTGTGSGKTESFLLPILDHLVRERDAGTLGPGVRALLLYPMNALANDQMRRLRGVLEGVPEITFGRYIGDTKNTRAEAEAAFASQNPGQRILSNETLSRQEMRERPPHLLLTNYAMLEYLLLRPADIELFESHDTWRFVVVDEAHVYDGASGTELAMLLRRLRNRVGADRLQCIATSATIGAEANQRQVVQFASDLFAAPVEWIPEDPSRQDLVVATRTEPKDGTWGGLDAEDWSRLGGLDDDTLGRELAMMAEGRDGSTFELAQSEVSMASLRLLLAAGPATLGRAAQVVFPDDDPLHARQGVAALVAVGSRLLDTHGVPLLSARYHLWLRATEGAFTCLAERDPHVHLARHDFCPTCDRRSFELGSCRACGTVHLVGSIADEDGAERFVNRHAADERATWLAITDEDAVEDEDDEPEQPEASTSTKTLLCVRCGALRSSGRERCPDPACGSAETRSVQVIDRQTSSLTACITCGGRSPSQVRQLMSGADATSAVVATSLYQALPAAGGDMAEMPGQGRKLLAFSDSRQAAAYFAPYMENSYERLQWRRLVALGTAAAVAAEGGPASFEDVAHATQKAATKAHMFSPFASTQQKVRESSRWMTAELVPLDERQSLEGSGLLRISLDLRGTTWKAPPPLLAAGFSEQECLDLVAVLLSTLRQQAVVRMAEDVDPADEIFEPRLGPIFARKTGADARKKVKSWLPTRGTNKRIDFVQRVLEAVGSELPSAEVLSRLWDLLEPTPWLSVFNHPSLGKVAQVDLDRLSWRLVEPGETFYRCSVCRRVFHVSVRAVCPTLRCSGELEEVSLPDVAEDPHHYRRLARTLDPSAMTSKEHTAQWTADEAASIQQQFVAGEVNLLSCSTTFELGVDVGELQSVFLRNVPPSTANYVQRAGRAGRRAASAALVVSLANRRSHDLSYFEDPVRMIAGEVRAPRIPLANERIDRRHAHSVVLAAFFRHEFKVNHHVWRKVGEFFAPEEAGDLGPARLEQFLHPVPESLTEAILATLPDDVCKEIDVAGNGWVGPLLDLVRSAMAQVVEEVEYFSAQRQQSFEAGKDGLAAKFGSVLKTLRGRDLIGFLATHNILPKYGFPVDVVEFRTSHVEQGRTLELSRDLGLAISEYAPGRQVVAAGRVWTSGGVYRLPNRDLVTYRYAHCKVCGAFADGLEDLTGTCHSCATPWSVRTYAVPEFGFMADATPAKVKETPPARGGSARVFVAGSGDEISEEQVRLGSTLAKVKPARHGRLVAISEGSGAGYFVCRWCGRGRDAARQKVEPAHRHLWKNQDCTGSFDRYSLGHSYETDVVSLDLGIGPDVALGSVRSLVYALLEGAAWGLGISRDEIDGTFAVREGTRHVVLFDTVPAGAGHSLAIAKDIGRVVEGAHRRVSSCECGEETSCSACLRNYRNQPFHEELSRAAAISLLVPLINKQ